MIDKYWKEMFKEYQIDNNHFVVDEFPEPLISAHFGVKNIIGESVETFKFHYMLCCFNPLKERVETEANFESLEEAIQNEKFWNFHLNEKNESLDFMRRFLSFLVKNKKNHWHVYIEKEGEILGSVVIGVTSQYVLGFNALVKESQRKKGIVSELSKASRSLFPEHNFFYWTKHSWFKNNCDQALDYYIV